MQSFRYFLRRQLILVFRMSCVLGVGLLYSINVQGQKSVESKQEGTVELHLPLQLEQQLEISDALQADLNDVEIDSIHVKSAIYWHGFQQGIKQGRSGYYVAPPHFAAWAIAEHGFVPLARIAEPLSYVIATNKSDKSLFEIGDLANKPICSSKPLSLDYLLINTTFEKSISTAIPMTVDSVAAEMKKVKSECAAYSISNHILDREALRGVNKYIRLAQSRRTKNYVLIAHPALATDLTDKIQQYFLSKRGGEQLKPLSLLFSNKGEWVKAKPGDYPAEYAKGLSKYWHRTKFE